MHRTTHAFPSLPGVLCLLAAAAAFTPVVRADVNSVQLLETDPRPPAALDKFDKLNFRLAYTSDRLVRVSVEPYFHGKRRPALNGGMTSYDAGAGEAYFWISYNDAATIDRVDLLLLDEDTGKTLATATAALDISWSGVAVGSPRSNAEWAERLQQDARTRAKQSAARSASRQGPGGRLLAGAAGLIIMAAGGLMAPGYFVLQVVCLWRWKGGWRKAAAAPIALMGPVVAYVLYASTIGGSNIAPIVILLAAPLGFMYLVVLWFLRRGALSTES
ncbi:MAG: hypothetical protein JSU00_25955 [Acidobacteria bacterium]|mgnify:CR=1 FL=1|nr:hypothetical protein [Acidobacteriota bacterium]